MADNGGFFSAAGGFMKRLMPGNSRMTIGGHTIPSPIDYIHRGIEAASGNPYGGGPPRSLMQSSNGLPADPVAGQAPDDSGLQPSGHVVATQNNPLGQPQPQPQAVPLLSGQAGNANFNNGWRNGAGGTGHGGGWRGINNVSQAAALGEVLANAKGNLGAVMGRPNQTEFDTVRVDKNGVEHQIGADSRLLSHAAGSGSGGSAQDFIRKNPERWAQMQREMRTGAGRG